MIKFFKQHVKIILLILLVLIAFTIRFYKLDQIPSSLYYDEVDYGYQARSLVETGRDYRGELSPFYVHSFNEMRTPIPVYFTVLTTLLFRTPELQVRMPFVIFGTLIVFLIFALIYLWTSNFTQSFLTSLIFAINPWQIQFSRFSHEVTVMMAFYLGGLICFYLALKNQKFKYLIFSVSLFSLSVYTYRTMSLFAPLTLICLFLIYRQKLLNFKLKKLGLLSLISAAIIIPFLYFTTIGAPNTPRINILAITSDPRIPIWIQRNREVDSADFQNPIPGRKAYLTSFLFHNKPLSYMSDFFNNYWQTFSTEFLLLDGDPNRRHSIGGMGEIFAIDFIPLLLGLFVLMKNLKQTNFQWLLIWFLIAPIPAAITLDGGKHASRLFLFSVPLLIILGFGWYFIIKKIQKFKKSNWLLSTVAYLYAIFFILYLHHYFIHYPLDSARNFGYGFKQAMQKISTIESNYKRIEMVDTKDPPMMYFLYWANIPPKVLQNYGTDFSEKIVKNQPLDKYKIADLPASIRKDPEFANFLKDDTLYLLTTRELDIDLRDKDKIPEGLKVEDVILYPDNEVAFYLVSKKKSI